MACLYLWNMPKCVLHAYNKKEYVTLWEEVHIIFSKTIAHNNGYNQILINWLIYRTEQQLLRKDSEASKHLSPTYFSSVSEPITKSWIKNYIKVSFKSQVNLANLLSTAKNQTTNKYLKSRFLNWLVQIAITVTLELHEEIMNI